MTPAEKQYRAQEAVRLCGEPLLVEAMAQLEKRALDDLLELKPGDHDGRLGLALELKVIRGFRERLRSVIMTGQEEARKKPAVA